MTDQPHHKNCEGDSSLRMPHAALDMRSRQLKGLKIERLLDLENLPKPLRVLEVGTGSGGIAHYFGTHPRMRCIVDAVDVYDNRLVLDGYHYQQVMGTVLPFENDSFDVVVTNHVIEHVGDEQAQRHHLSELHRVLRTGGIGYIAVPNRWMLIEPHFRLAFLSWMPRSWRTPYLHLMRKGKRYDCEPLQLSQLENFLAQAGFGYENISIDAMRTTIEIEHSQSFVLNVLRNLPDRVWVPLLNVMPTLIYRFWPQ
ncbi:SAM-dependent methyltransferase [Rhodanobacter sp. K2T2]|uniref:class I SAM-dependent methyltransferase n=1 Tax=Rhodanobacter sp. K2T2 TaxID=2723085 RepID=UPI0017FD8F20|nr:class I SAM-dependent methyltransferase [Rhodanobacter sp. K2T2]NYE28088.1 SAM-dependent methyltransferase [Rhodanobacter sp. K2T2]